MRYFGLATVLYLIFHYSICEEDGGSREEIGQMFECPAEVVKRSTGEGRIVEITWPRTHISNNAITSGPICISENGQVVTRKCVYNQYTAEWKPLMAPECSHIQIPYYLSNKCPRPYEPMYVDDKIICILVTSPKSWSPSCVTSGTEKYLLDLEQEIFILIVEGLRKAKVSSVWLPVKRDDEYGPLQIQLPGKRWGDIYSLPEHLQVSWSKNFSVKERCLEMNIPESENSTVYIGTNNCDIKNHIVCVFLPDDDDLLLQLACPPRYYTSRYANNQKRCFSIHKNILGVSWEKSNTECLQNGHLVSINSASDSYLIEELFDLMNIEDKECWMGLHHKSGSRGYEWIKSNNSATELTYFNWDIKTNFENNLNTYGAVSDDSLWHLKSSFSKLKCYICEKPSESPHTDMILRYDNELDMLTLNVINPAGLWKESENDPGFQCFTDSGGDFIQKVKTEVIKMWNYKVFAKPLYILKNVLAGNSNIISQFPKILYRLKVSKNSGNYWCEGHRVFSFELVKSRTVLTWGNKPGYIYALTLDILKKCKNQQLCEPTFSNIFSGIAKDIKHKLKSESGRLEIHDVSPMKILDISGSGDLRMLFHVRITLIHANLEKTHDYALEVLQSFQQHHYERYRLVSLYGVYHCPESVTEISGQVLHWPMTPFGHTVAPAELCIDSNGLPVQRSCQGNFTFGASWSIPTSTCSKQTATSTTQTLHNLATTTSTNNNLTSSDINYSMAQLASENLSNVTAADVYYLSCTLKNIAKYPNGSITAADDIKRLQDFTKIINSVYDIDTKTLAKSQYHLNATNILVDAVESQLQSMAEAVNKFETKGFFVSASSKVIIQISDPLLTNITGIALVKKNVSTYKEKSKNRSNFSKQSFDNYKIVQLKSNQTVKDLDNLGDIRLATWVPQGLLDEILNRSNTMGLSIFNDSYANMYISSFRKKTPYVVIVMFYKDNIFQQKPPSTLDLNDRMNVGTHVVSVSIPGMVANLPGYLPIIFKPLSKEKINDRKCAFWDFSFNSTTPSLSLGGWSGEGCLYAGKTNGFSQNGNMDMCVCSHLTNFAELLLGPSLSSIYDDEYDSIDNNKKDKYILIHLKILDIISIIGCTLSILGVIGVIFTAAVFKSWREKPGTKILLQLATAIGLQMVVFLLANINTRSSHEVKNTERLHWTQHNKENIQECPEDKVINSDSNIVICSLKNDESETLCIVFGVLLHYCVLCGFSWMLVTAFLQFQRYVKVLGNKRPAHFVLKFSLLGWGTPLIPVIILLAISPYTYVPPYESHICYPTGYYLYGGVIAPAAVIILINSFVFVKVLKSILTTGIDGKLRVHTDKNLVLSQLKIGILLFFLLGMSWIFGLLLTTGPKILFSYLFCLTATIQGFVVFLFFVVCDPSTRHLWTRLVNSWGKFVMKLTKKNVSNVKFYKEEIKPSAPPAESEIKTNIPEEKNEKHTANSENLFYRPDRY